MNNNNLWEKLSNRHQTNKLNRDTSDNNALYNSIIYGSDTNKNSNNFFGGSSEDWGNGVKGFSKLYNSFANSGSAGSVNPQISSAVDFEVNGIGGGSGSAITNAINGNSGNSLTNAIGTEVNTGSAGGGFASNVPWAAIGQFAKKGYNSISGTNDKDYSDVEESVIYPLQGASMGAQFGPWGALGGALYGLGYSFKDDLGMKDSNFLTQILHPIGMGDGGGLRIGGKPILDLG